jgi:hypothetical protein
MKDEGGSVAIYWDFENLQAGLVEAWLGEGAYAKPDTRFKPQEPLIDVQAITDLAASFGPVAINRAYGNWQFFGRYRDALLQNAIELIQLFPPGASAKNGADIRLCLDAAEDLYRHAHIGTVLIVGGDSDFMPAAQKIKAAGRTLIGVGTRKNTNRHWAKSCHEFRYYENLVQPVPPVAAAVSPDAGVGGSTGVPPAVPALATPATGADPCADILRRAVRLMSEKSGEAWVTKASIPHMIKRLDSTFDPKEHGHDSYSGMFKALAELIEVRQGTFDHEVRLR